MDERLHFPATAAAGYDDHVGQYTGKLVPRLLEIARLKPGQTVLEVATGTGIAAFAAADVVGKSGGIVATDISPHMLDRARERLASFQNSSFSVEDGQALSFPDQSFDAVICNMGLMYFPIPAKGSRSSTVFFGRMVGRLSLSSMDRVRCIGCHPVANSEASVR